MRHEKYVEHLRRNYGNVRDHIIRGIALDSRQLCSHLEHDCRELGHSIYCKAAIMKTIIGDLLAIKSGIVAQE